MVESMEEAVPKEMAGQDGGGDDGDARLRREQPGGQGDGDDGDHLRVQPGGGRRISQSSKEFDDLRMRFEKKDISDERPHSQNCTKDILSENGGGPPLARVRRQILPSNTKKPFNYFEAEVTNGISADENWTNREQGIVISERVAARHKDTNNWILGERILPLNLNKPYL